MVVNPSNLPENDPKFSTDSGLDCPVPTCSMYTDIVFVLDYSGTVDSSEWRQQANFVIAVMNNFTFGDNAAAAAIVKFCGPYCGKQPTWVSIPGCRWSHASNDWNYTTCSSSYMTGANTAEVMAGSGPKDSMTVSTTKSDLISVMQQTRYPSGQTCQAFGLELAMKVFDRSPRAGYNRKPHRIVIAVTDGDDYCPNRTRAAAEKLKSDYDALFLGVGVGLDCQYDKNFIESLTSTIGDQKGYYDVQDYSRILEVSNKIFTPLCDEFHSDCGPDCQGFCGCGDCFCPECEQTGGICADYRCSASAGSSNGCELTDIDHCQEDDKCTQYVCDDSTGVEKCNEVKTCAAVEALNPGSCRTVACDLKDGKCKVELNHAFCTKFDTECVKWECAGENVTAIDAVSGCTVKRNITAECAAGNKGCMEYTCDYKNGQCIAVDTCKRANTACRTFECVNGQCVGTDVPGPANTSCATYKCDDVSGWYTSFEKTSQYCYDIYEGSKSCKSFYCDTSLEDGCTFDAIDDCSDLCDADKRNECLEEGDRDSSVDKCVLTICKVKKDDNNETVPYCLPNRTINCLESDAADRARELNRVNTNKSICYSVECSMGQCNVINYSRPNTDNACQENFCVEYSEGWHWELRPTNETTDCWSDNCTHRECVPDKGCVWTDICRNRTTECETFSCKDNQCVGEKYILKDLQCAYEECINGKVVKIPKNLTEVCPNTNKCYTKVCSELGECVDKEVDHGNDPCKIYTCDPASGWKSTPKCDDGLFCTIDRCTVNGDCRHEDLDCYKEINMTDYPCFRAICKENPKKGNHTCSRKLKDGVFIDVCGNCIRQDGTEASSDDSIVTACVEAPTEDILKEPLAAATIAMIVLGAILIGAAIALSSILGTKVLLERAKEANNQSAHSNPLFEDNTKEMSNPTFMEEVDVEG